MYPIGMISPMIPNLMKLAHEIDDPPQVFYLLREYAKEYYPNPIKTNELAKYCRGYFFDFDYPLEIEDKEHFECMIINHFLMRRIAYETVTAFKISLEVKLNEIMPLINKLFVALDGWELFTDGEMTTRDLSDNRITNNNSTNSQTTTGERSSQDIHEAGNEQTFSDTPENKMQDIRDGNYASEFTVNKSDDTLNSASNDSTTTTGENTSSVDDKNTVHETVKHTPGDKIDLYTKFLQNRQNVYTILFKELEPLFYQLVD